MLSAVFAILFGLSLFPGRRPLCLRFAERISDGILPDGADAYCRRLTVVWFLLLCALAVLSVAATLIFGGKGLAVSSLFCGGAVAFMFVAEGFVRRRRFSVVFHTSGSTSKPKEIVKTFESLAKEVAFHRDRMPYGAGSVFLATIEPHHMYGKLWREMLPAAFGCSVDPEVILAPESLIEKMKSAEKVFFVTTPTFLKRFCAYAEQYDVPQNCVEITTSGALLDAETSAAAKRVFGIAPFEIFGSTETGGVAWRRQDGSADASVWTVFDPVSVKTDCDGRLVVEKSPFSFKKDFTMGDGVELLSGGRKFNLLGRMDRIVKIAEQRVSLPEMEERIRALDGVEDVALVALEGAKGPYLGAVVAVSDPQSKSRDAKSVLETRQRFMPIFPRGAVPKRFRFVSELPRNAQGKVLDSDLKALLEKNCAESDS